MYSILTTALRDMELELIPGSSLRLLVHSKASGSNVKVCHKVQKKRCSNIHSLRSTSFMREGFIVIFYDSTRTKLKLFYCKEIAQCPTIP